MLVTEDKKAFTYTKTISRLVILYLSKKDKTLPPLYLEIKTIWTIHEYW